MNPFLSAAMNFLLVSSRKKLTKKEMTNQDKKEIQKIESMGLFSAISYLQNK